MLAATRLTRHGRLTEATAALQRMLGGHAAPNFDAATIEGMIDRADAASPPPRVRSPNRRPPLDSDARFVARTFTNDAGTRPYKLYIPNRPREAPPPLIVMLHGCTQSADDFAAGTRMNVAAEAHGCLVAYPDQPRQANTQKCWNWFNPSDQRRDAGEPSLIAGITRQVMGDFAIDPARVFIAGMSAGGAAAAIMGDAYPDLYAAIGVHSGLACGAARDIQSAFAVMQRGGSGTGASDNRRIVPTIVFHGDQDSTVNPLNGEAVVAQAVKGMPFRKRQESGRVPGGHAYQRTLYLDAAGLTMVEQWVVRNAGHAWFGGSPAGSYTDPMGPDATAEMMRFFLQHPR
jgi:poly(hydroxyalkanoate) depolymerase family esterase